ncbi:hypothetical protein [Desulfosporosinus shakirovi]|uniref:hypothetical protein n=1 Tax=Desulfosporosinus shakirovi TaxID=2885154 RepID=UPI001E56D173|nr:hypothetical protein [Desulfosporosinus sp. SRJS8]MCB8814764.1 hypothetical protein [Desulfosporosinus sp. SRJS8]
MNKKSILKWFTIGVMGVGVLTLTVLFANSNNAYSAANHSEREITLKDSAIKNFNIDTTKVKQLYRKDLHGNSTAVSQEMKTKALVAFSELIKNGDTKIGDYTPIYFFEGNNVSIAIKHADGSMTLTKFDISEDGIPIKIDAQSKEVK